MTRIIVIIFTICLIVTNDPDIFKIIIIKRENEASS